MTESGWEATDVGSSVDSNAEDDCVRCPLADDSPQFDSLTTDAQGRLRIGACPLASSIADRVRFESLLSELSSKFINLAADEVDSQIEAALRRVVEVLGIDRSGFGEVSADGSQLIVTHSWQLPDVPPAPTLDLHVLFPAYSGMIRQGKVVRVPDDLPADATAEREYCRQVGLKFNLTIPLVVMGSVVGGIGFSSFRAQKPLPDEFIPRLRLLGDIFTNALARKRADEALRLQQHLIDESQSQLRRLAAKLLNAQEQERRRIAREMHDDWTQRLAVLGIEISKLEAHLAESAPIAKLFESIRSELVSLSEDVHGLSRQLHPAILDDLGLVEALRSECASFSRREEITIHYEPDELPQQISAEAALCVYRVAQESLRNIAKHSGASDAWVLLRANGPELMLQIKDGGAGFDSRTCHTGPGLGLSSMSERVNLVRGRLAITSKPGEGTLVDVRVPLSGSVTA